VVTRDPAPTVPVSVSGSFIGTPPSELGMEVEIPIIATPSPVG
jgi:hypothetical protein